MTDADYERGQLTGKVHALEKMMEHHKERMDSHAKRLRILERAHWILLGIVGVIQLMPAVMKLVEVLK